jgi:hypothetical protein
MMGVPETTEEEVGLVSQLPLDVPDKSFVGPF